MTNPASKITIEFDDRSVRRFMIASIIWGIVGMLVGVIAATQFGITIVALIIGRCIEEPAQHAAASILHRLHLQLLHAALRNPQRHGRRPALPSRLR